MRKDNLALLRVNNIETRGRKPFTHSVRPHSQITRITGENIRENTKKIIKRALERTLERTPERKILSMFYYQPIELPAAFRI